MKGASIVTRAVGARSVSGTCRKNGFTLIEVLVALFVLGVATTIVVGLFGRSVALSKHNRSRSVATGGQAT